MSAHFSMTAVATKIEAGEVPAELAYAPVAACLLNHAKSLLGDDGVRMLSHLVAHGLIKGGGLELDAPKEFKDKVELGRVALMTALTFADSLRTATADERAAHTAIICAYKAVGASLHAAGLQQVKAEEEGKATEVALTIGTKKFTERNPFSPLSRVAATPLAWATVGQDNGGVREFAASVREAVTVQGGRSAAGALMRSVLGPLVSSTTRNEDLVKTLAGDVKGLPAAIVCVTAMGSGEMVEKYAKKWGAVYGEPVPLTVELVGETPRRNEGETVYCIDLGDKLVSDALLAQMTRGLITAAAKAAADGNESQKAVPKHFAVTIGVGKDNSSYFYMTSVGELGTAARSSIKVADRMFRAYDVPAKLRRGRVWLYASGMEVNEMMGGRVLEVVAAKLRVAVVRVEMANDYTLRKAKIQGSVALEMQENLVVNLMGLCEEAKVAMAGALLVNGTLKLSSQEADTMMLGGQEFVVVALSEAKLKLGVLEMGMEFSERNSGNNNNEQTASVMEELKQMQLRTEAEMHAQLSKVSESMGKQLEVQQQQLAQQKLAQETAGKQVEQQQKQLAAQEKQNSILLEQLRIQKQTQQQQFFLIAGLLQATPGAMVNAKQLGYVDPTVVVEGEEGASPQAANPEELEVQLEEVAAPQEDSSEVTEVQQQAETLSQAVSSVGAEGQQPAQEEATQEAAGQESQEAREAQEAQAAQEAQEARNKETAPIAEEMEIEAGIEKDLEEEKEQEQEQMAVEKSNRRGAADVSGAQPEQTPKKKKSGEKNKKKDKNVDETPDGQAPGSGARLFEVHEGHMMYNIWRRVNAWIRMGTATVGMMTATVLCLLWILGRRCVSWLGAEEDAPQRPRAQQQAEPVLLAWVNGRRRMFRSLGRRHASAQARHGRRKRKHSDSIAELDTQGNVVWWAGLAVEDERSISDCGSGGLSTFLIWQLLRRCNWRVGRAGACVVVVLYMSMGWWSSPTRSMMVENVLLALMLHVSAGGKRLGRCVLMLGSVSMVMGSHEEEVERVALWNTRGLTVMGAAATGFFFSAKALLKLGAIDSMLDEKQPSAGVLLELSGSATAMRKTLQQWFRRRGYKIRVRAGQCGPDGVIRNGVAVFYHADMLREVSWSSRLAERMLRVTLRRKNGRLIDVVAWHGMHEDSKFREQVSVIEGLTHSGESSVILADVNRLCCSKHGSSGRALSSSDKRWKNVCGFNCQCCGAAAADDARHARLIPMMNEDQSAVTRRAMVEGEEVWSVLDRALCCGAERGNWVFDEIIWSEHSDHAFVIFHSVITITEEQVEQRARLPSMKSWKEQDIKRWVALTRRVMTRAEEPGGTRAEWLRRADAEMMDMAEVVEQERKDRAELKGTFDAKGLLGAWKWRLQQLKDIKTCKQTVYSAAWITHPKCTLRRELYHCQRIQASTEETWELLVQRCRKEIAFCAAAAQGEARAAKRLLDMIQRMEETTDPLLRAKMAWGWMRSGGGPQDKLSTVAREDNPENGFVVAPAQVRAEAANIGKIAQQEYLANNPPAESAFEAFAKHFLEPFSELKAPDGEEFSLDKVLTYDMFEDELFFHVRHKAVGPRVGGAMSALELLRMLGKEELMAYYEAAKYCVVHRELPAHWKAMVFVLLKKKHGDQRKVRKMREIALMDQCLKLMLKCVKRMSFDRMVGRTGEDNHGWVPGHGALNAALIMDCILGQARELGHDIFVLYLDLAQFFPAIQRRPRRFAEYLIGLPDEVALLAKEVFRGMQARFDTAYGLSDSFEILTGDLMGCVLSPSHARCLLTSISVAIAAISAGVRLWGCETKAREVAQTMMADDWAGFNMTEASLQAQWATWVDFAMVSGSPIGVAGLEKTVVTAARMTGGRWVDVKVKLAIPKGGGGMNELPDYVPQLPFRKSYPHMGVPRALDGSRTALRAKLRKGILGTMAKVKKVKLDRTQHISCANVLKGSYVGYYSATAGLAFHESEALEALWRATYKACFRSRRDVPSAHFYGGIVDKIGDSLHGRHVMVDAMAALRATCAKALASPVDSTERAAARSALARRCRRWGCTEEPTVWLGSRAHLLTAVEMRVEMEKAAFKGEAFDYFILFEALLTPHDQEIRAEKEAAGQVLAPRRAALTDVHGDNVFGEALTGGAEHEAWRTGRSPTLVEVCGFGMPAVLSKAGIARVEHVCESGVNGPKLRTATSLMTFWELPKTTAANSAAHRVLQAVRESKAELTTMEFKPLTSTELFQGVQRLEATWAGRAGWPATEVPQSRRTDGDLTKHLMQVREGLVPESMVDWCGEVSETYGDVQKRKAEAWWDGAPKDVDRYSGARLVAVWPDADHRWEGDLKEYGGTFKTRPSEEEKALRRQAMEGWTIDDEGELSKDERQPDDGDFTNNPCMELLWRATRHVKEVGGELDQGREGKLRPAGKWAVNVATSRRLAQEWGRLQSEYGIEHAGATDGGRQHDDTGQPVAARAGLRNDGGVVGGAMDATTIALSSYETEMQALIDLLRSWPDEAKVLIAMDARSPVQAVIKFRMAHVNRRADYFDDDLLDELLAEIERMHTILFYWLKGHSGATPNEAADWHATKFLDEEVQQLPRAVRRHVSMTFKAERSQFRWTSERAERWVTLQLRARSSRTVWNKRTSWNLTYKEARIDAATVRALRAAQMLRQLPGDEAKRDAYSLLDKDMLKCDCSAGGWMSTKHWWFKCTHTGACICREVIIDKARALDDVLKRANKNVEHKQTAALLRALQQTGGGSCEEDEAEAFRWLVGDVDEPEEHNRTHRRAATQVIGAAGAALRKASNVLEERIEAATKAERMVSLGRRWVRKWWWKTVLQGPWVWGKPREAGWVARKLGKCEVWDVAGSEWRALRALQCWCRRRQRWSKEAACRAQRMDTRVGLCHTRGTGKVASKRKAAAVKKKIKEAAAKEKRQRFASVMGAGIYPSWVQGAPCLAPGLVDVDVHFKKKKKTRQRRGGGKRRAPKKAGVKTKVRAAVNKKGRKRVSKKEPWTADGSSDSDESESDEDSEELDVQEDGVDDKEGGEGVSGMEVQESDEGAVIGGETRRQRAVEQVIPKVGDRLQVYWSEDDVWFRGDVIKADGTEIGTVRYLMEGWPDYEHEWKRVRWKPWTASSVVDPREAEYDGEAWMGERDFEAEKAAAQGTMRRDDEAQKEREQRMLRRGAERQKRTRTAQDKEEASEGTAASVKRSSRSEAGPSSAGEAEQTEQAGGERSGVAEGKRRATSVTVAKAKAKPKGIVKKKKVTAKDILKGLLVQMATANARAGTYMDWPTRTVYARAAAARVQPARLVKELLEQLSVEREVMLVDDEVHYIGKDVQGRAGEAEPNQSTDRDDDADMLSPDEPLRDGSGESDDDGAGEPSARGGRGQKRKTTDDEQVGE